MLPVPWWIIALAAIVFVCLIARIVSLIDERRRLKNEITALEGDEEKTDSTPDTKMGGAED